MGATAKRQRSSKSPTSATGVTNMKEALGVPINAMNPYSNPACEHVNQVVDRMEAPAANRSLPQGVMANTAGAFAAQLDVEIDNYQGGEWSFMGQMYKIKRGLLVPYRYEVRNSNGVGSGVWAVGKLLIGYIGANGA
jgi:hypothetical protein